MHDTIVVPAELVRRARRAQGLSQAAFAANLGKSQGVLSRYEHGHVDPPSDVLMHCLHILQSPAGSPNPAWGEAVNGVNSALAALTEAIAQLQRLAVPSRDTAMGDDSHSAPAGEPQS